MGDRIVGHTQLADRALRLGQQDGAPQGLEGDEAAGVGAGVALLEGLGGVEATDGVEAVEEIARLGVGLDRKAQHLTETELPGDAGRQARFARPRLAGDQQRHAKRQGDLHGRGSLGRRAVTLGGAQRHRVHRGQGVRCLGLRAAATGVEAHLAQRTFSLSGVSGKSRRGSAPVKA